MPSTTCNTVISFDTESNILLMEVKEATAAKIDSPSSASSWPINLMYCCFKCVQICAA